MSDGNKSSTNDDAERVSQLCARSEDCNNTFAGSDETTRETRHARPFARYFFTSSTDPTTASIGAQAQTSAYRQITSSDSYAVHIRASQESSCWSSEA